MPSMPSRHVERVFPVVRVDTVATAPFGLRIANGNVSVATNESQWGLGMVLAWQRARAAIDAFVGSAYSHALRWPAALNRACDMPVDRKSRHGKDWVWRP
jgi:hypothetical protein